MADEAQRLTALLEGLRERCAEMVEQYQGSPERSAEIIRSIELDVAVRAYLTAGVPERAATTQPKCERCGGEGFIDQTGYGEYRPCPECNEDGSRPVHIR